MRLREKVRSETSLLIKHSKENSSQLTLDTSPSSTKLPTLSSRTPLSTKSDKILFNSQYSHLPPGAVSILPQDLKGREGCVNYFARNEYSTMFDRSVPGRKENYEIIKKTIPDEEAAIIVDSSKRYLSQLGRTRKRGSMFSSEFWTKHQVKDILKAAQFDKLYKAFKVNEREGLAARLKKLEGVYENRQDKNLPLTDVGKILDEFYNQGINAPSLKPNRRIVPSTIKTLGSLPKSEESIFETEEYHETEGVETIGVPSIQETRSTESDGYTEEETNTYITSLKSLNSLSRKAKNVKSFAGKISKASSRRVFTEMGDSTPDLDSNDRHFLSTSPSHSRLNTCSPYIFVEDSKSIPVSSPSPVQSLTNLKENRLVKEDSKGGSLQTIKEVTKIGKENTKKSVVGEGNKNRKLVSENLGSVPRKVENQPESKAAEGKNFQQKLLGLELKKKIVRKDKNMWFVPPKSKR